MATRTLIAATSFLRGLCDRCPADWLMCLIVLATANLTSTARADDEPAAEPAAAPVVGAADAKPEEDRETEKQRRAMAGLLALCGILIGGLMLVVLVMLWGARLRRMARRELPAQKTLQNELWYLKPPKSPPE